MAINESLTLSKDEGSTPRENLIRTLSKKIVASKKMVGSDYRPENFRRELIGLDQMFLNLGDEASYRVIQEVVKRVESDLKTSNGSKLLESAKKIFDILKSLENAVFKIILGEISEQQLKKFDDSVSTSQEDRTVSEPEVTTDQILIPLAVQEVPVELCDDRVSSKISDEFRKKLINAIKLLQGNTDGSEAQREGINQLVFALDQETGRSMGDIADGISKKIRKNWVVNHPSLLIKEEMIPRVELLLKLFFESTQSIGHEDKLNVRYIGNYFVLEIPLGPLLDLNEVGLAIFIEKAEMSLKPTFQEFTRRIDGTISYFYCQEVDVSSFSAREITVQGRKVLISESQFVKFLSSSDAKGKLVLGNELFGFVRYEKDEEEKIVMSINGGNEEIIVPISAYSEPKIYFSQKSNGDYFQRVGFAGSSRVGLGVIATVWDIEIAVARWKFRTKKTVSAESNIRFIKSATA